MADYCTLAQVQAALPESPLSTTTDTAITGEINRLITAASRLIDREVGQADNYFYPSSDTATRYYDGSKDLYQDIDDMVSLTSLAVAESGGTGASDYTTWTENTDFYVFPENHTALNLPICKLVIDRNGSKGIFPRFRKCIKVVGIFGYSVAPPDDIEQACIMQVVIWYMRAKQAFQQTGGGAPTGSLTYTNLDPDVKQILAHYALWGMA
jgi:hypothetical protein